MDRLMEAMAGFHDSMTKEIHLINRGAVEPDGGIDMFPRAPKTGPTGRESLAQG